MVEGDRRKINNGYNSKDLTEALEGRDIIYQSIQREIDEGILDLDDEQLAIWERVKCLSPLEKDILYVYSRYKSSTGSKWGVSTTHIYNLLKEIKNKLNDVK